MKNNMNKLVYYKCHERIDLTKRSGYEHYLMKLVYSTEDNSSSVKHHLWQKTYNDYVSQEIRQLRGRTNVGMKTCICEDTFNFIFISSTFSFRLTNIHRFVNKKCEDHCKISHKNWTSRDNYTLTASEEVVKDNIMVLVKNIIGIEGLKDQ